MSLVELYAPLRVGEVSNDLIRLFYPLACFIVPIWEEWSGQWDGVCFFLCEVMCVSMCVREGLPFSMVRGGSFVESYYGPLEFRFTLKA